MPWHGAEKLGGAQKEGNRVGQSHESGWAAASEEAARDGWLFNRHHRNHTACNYLTKISDTVSTCCESQTKFGVMRFR